MTVRLKLTEKQIQRMLDEAIVREMESTITSSIGENAKAFVNGQKKYSQALFDIGERLADMMFEVNTPEVLNNPQSPPEEENEGVEEDGREEEEEETEGLEGDVGQD